MQKALEKQLFMQEMVENTYSVIYQSLWKFPGDPYELKLKPNFTPARPRKVPIYLEETFHEEVKKACRKIS